MREQIRSEIESISPIDPIESKTRTDALAWIESGAELCRLEKPDFPNKHLVSYFPVLDGEYILLVDHINARLWLPSGGHVEVGEHPRDTAAREAKEELSIVADFMFEHPLMISSTQTVGKTAGHTDVSLWYALNGNRRVELEYDQSEFHSARWFHQDEISEIKTDPELGRFLRKLRHIDA